MSVLFIVVPLALLVVAVAVGAYAWAARHGQFDDLATPPLRALHDDEPAPRREPSRVRAADDPSGVSAAPSEPCRSGPDPPMTGA